MIILHMLFNLYMVCLSKNANRSGLYKILCAQIYSVSISVRGSCPQ